MSTEEKQKRGFAAMSPERRREIASMGGKSAHAQGTAHIFTTEEAKEAGKKGGKARVSKGRRKKRQLSLPLPPESEVRRKEGT